LSTLTKILIILLTLSSIFLCGLVVTYVANAQNYKEKYAQLRTETDALREKHRTLQKQLKEKTEQAQQQELQLRGKIDSIEQQSKNLQVKLDNSEREKATLLQKVNNWTSITKDFYKTNENQTVLLEQKLNELHQVRQRQVTQENQLKEVSDSLIEKMAIIDKLQTEKRRLLEEKADLEQKLNQIFKPIGEVVTAGEPVTRRADKIKLATIPAALTAEIGLSGVVKEVDISNSMASISLGQADGVEKGMRFHVTRDDEFICDIVIIEIDPEVSVGVLEIVQHAPEAGDTATTNF